MIKKASALLLLILVLSPLAATDRYLGLDIGFDYTVGFLPKSVILLPLYEDRDGSRSNQSGSFTTSANYRVYYGDPGYLGMAIRFSANSVLFYAQDDAFYTSDISAPWQERMEMRLAVGLAGRIQAGNGLWVELGSGLSYSGALLPFEVEGFQAARGEIEIWADAGVLWDFSSHFSLRAAAEVRYAFAGCGTVMETENTPGESPPDNGDWNYDLAIEPYIGIAWKI